MKIVEIRDRFSDGGVYYRVVALYETDVRVLQETAQENNLEARVFMADAPSHALAWMRQLNGKEGECK